MSKEKQFLATFDSLRSYECPDWFRDVKFGIWSHWGPQSVPMAGDWYARNMYLQGSEQYNYHVRHYGHPSKFGYLDICKLWKAENFDPEHLMELYYKAGARYFVAQATHHDNFFNYDSKVNPYNSVKIGPGKDICGMWQEAARKYNMRFGITEHLAASFNWWYANKASDTYGPYKGVPYDGAKHKDFYHDNEDVTKYMFESGKVNENYAITPEWMTDNPGFQKYWENAVGEMIDKFQPDLLYSDSALPFERSDEHSNYEPGLRTVALLYNTSIAKNGRNEAVYTQKNRNPDIYRVGILDVEKSQLPGIFEQPWQTDTCIGNWFMDARQTYKRPDQIIEMLVDIISKNGTMLLNVLQRPDGTIDEEAEYILKELAGWFEICAEAVYETRPFRVFGEGDTRVKIDGFTENKTNWNSSDYRFVRKGSTVYAYMMAAPENRVAVIKSLCDEDRISSVRLLGFGEVAFRQFEGVLVVKLPQELPTAYTNCLAIETEISD